MSASDRERLDDLLVSFRRDLRAADRSPRTLVLYSRAVDRFADWLADRGREPVLGEFTKAAIGAHLGEMLDRVTASTVAMHYRGLKRFSRWLVAEDCLPADVMVGLEKPKPKEHPVPVLTDADITALLRACDDTAFDLAMVRMLMDCGQCSCL